MGWHFQWWQSSPYIARFSKVVVPDSMCTVGVAADAVMSVSMPPPLPGAPWHARWNQVGHVWVSQVNQHRWGTGDVGKCEPVREPVCVCASMVSRYLLTGDELGLIESCCGCCAACSAFCPLTFPFKSSHPWSLSSAQFPFDSASPNAALFAEQCKIATDALADSPASSHDWFFPEHQMALCTRIRGFPRFSPLIVW